MYYDSLTIGPGAVVATGGFRIFVKTVLTLGNASLIHANGTAGASGSPGLGAPTGSLGGGGSASAAANANGALPPGASVGGSGGNCNNGSLGFGGVAVAPTAAQGGSRVFRATAQAAIGTLRDGTLAYGGGAGGNNGLVLGGGGGGVLTVAASTIVVTGAASITANGGDGMIFSVFRGGGGGGGAVVLISDAPLPAGLTVQANGGSAGQTWAGANGQTVLLTP